MTRQDGKWQTLRVAMACRLPQAGFVLLTRGPVHPQIIYQRALALSHFVRRVHLACSITKQKLQVHYNTEMYFRLYRWRTGQPINFTFVQRFLR